MNARLWQVCLIAGLIFALSPFAQAQPVSVPAGTTVGPLRYAEELRELITGVKTTYGQVIGLSVNPVKDTNYNYEIMIIGDSCLIRASPRVKGLCGFATLGTPSRLSPLDHGQLSLQA